MKLVSVVMDMKSQLDTVIHQQQLILQELTKVRVTKTPQLRLQLQLNKY
jgi:hypothetical protein